jgi:hypothetical protein
MLELMDTIHEEMYLKAVELRNQNLTTADNWVDFMNALN